MPAWKIRLTGLIRKKGIAHVVFVLVSSHVSWPSRIGVYQNQGEATRKLLVFLTTSTGEMYKKMWRKRVNETAQSIFYIPNGCNRRFALQWIKARVMHHFLYSSSYSASWLSECVREFDNFAIFKAEKEKGAPNTYREPTPGPSRADTTYWFCPVGWNMELVGWHSVLRRHSRNVAQSFLKLSLWWSV